VRRWLLVGPVLGLAALDLVAKAAAQQELLEGRSVDLGLVDLRLAFNSGTAFSLGAGLPSWLIVAVVALITAGVAIFAWREVPRASPLMRLGLTGMLAGAIANLVDRAGDGVVTDYLHTGWWPTFNLADVFITFGAAALLLAALRPADHAVNGDVESGSRVP
jgi:signal peptidase II